MNVKIQEKNEWQNVRTVGMRAGKNANAGELGLPVFVRSASSNGSDGKFRVRKDLNQLKCCEMG